MLLGEYQHSIDEKGRLAVPAKFRKFLSGGVVVTRGLDANPCLYLYPVSEWENFAEKLSRLPINQKDSRAYARWILSSASHAEIDSQGRILIPDVLRQFAGLKASAVIVGLHNRAEIWNDERWSQYRAAIEQKTEEIAERLGELGL